MANLKKKEIWLLALVVIFFAVLGFFGLGQIYHQDEYRWATIANPFFNNFQSPHPPLTRYLLRATGVVFGFDYLRIVPLFFGLLNLFLVFLVSKFTSKNSKVALWAAFLFAVSTYSLIAALQIDIDGAILPFFVLLGTFAYLNFVESKNKIKWLLILLVATIGGFLSKLSYFLFLGALAIEYFLHLKNTGRYNYSKLVRKLAYVFLPVIGLVFIFYIFYSAKLAGVISYAKHFNVFNFKSRAYFDLGFKLMKSLVWLSPLLFLPVIAGLFQKDIFKKYRFWFLYLFLNSLFYLVAFDFTKLTIERYLMFLIVPTCIISAEIIYNFLNGFNFSKNQVKIYFSILIVGILSFLILKSSQTILPLNPKSAYVSHIKHLNFNFLVPLNGGSGPIGFYASAEFVLIIWLVSVIIISTAFFRKKYRQELTVLFLLIGVIYNIALTSEYLWGVFYGSSSRVAKATVNYVVNNPSVKGVITYNDIGAYELRLTNKYISRFYTAESRDYTPKLSQFKGYYMIIDFPEIDKSGRYWPLIGKCPLIKEFSDKKIKSYILNCS